jgi:quinol monooxygenase YgiN
VTSRLIDGLIQERYVIVILGSVDVRPDSLESALKLALEHCARSREEPGCVSHDCFQAVGRPNILQFVEVWSDMTVLRAHFALADSKQFAAEIGKLAGSPPTMRILKAEELG